MSRYTAVEFGTYSSNLGFRYPASVHIHDRGTAEAVVLLNEERTPMDISGKEPRGIRSSSTTTRILSHNAAPKSICMYHYHNKIHNRGQTQLEQVNSFRDRDGWRRVALLSTACRSEAGWLTYHLRSRYYNTSDHVVTCISSASLFRHHRRWKQVEAL